MEEMNMQREWSLGGEGAVEPWRGGVVEPWRGRGSGALEGRGVEHWMGGGSFCYVL